MGTRMEGRQALPAPATPLKCHHWGKEHKPCHHQDPGDFQTGCLSLMCDVFNPPAEPFPASLPGSSPKCYRFKLQWEPISRSSLSPGRCELSLPLVPHCTVSSFLPDASTVSTVWSRELFVTGTTFSFVFPLGNGTNHTEEGT